MEFDYLKNFTKRMKKVGSYGLLFKNSMQKGTWKKYGFEQFHEQTNLIFSVLLFLMEQSLKEDFCTMDDIGSFLDTVNMRWFQKKLSFDECRELGDFIVNTVLCDEGKAMYFPGFNFEEGTYEEISVSFIQNKIVYLDGDVKRTSYYLTDEGYQLLLSTLEIENHMMLTIQEMIFKMHLEKASYSKAVDDIKNIFNRFRIQLQKIREAMHRIRKNALLYSISDYKSILEDNLEIIEDTKAKFVQYRDNVKKRVFELEEKDIHIKKLGLEDEENLKSLKTIEYYLNRALDEHQKILSLHFDLKSVYTKELEELSQMALIKRFQFRSEVYDKVIEDANYLEEMHYFLSPLFSKELPKIYNLNKALEIQKPVKEKIKDDEGQILEVEDEEWKEENKKRLLEKKTKYLNSLSVLLNYAFDAEKIYLSEIKDEISTQELDDLIPSVEIFKEIMVELIKIRTMDIEVFRAEQKEYTGESSMDFQLSTYCLELIEQNPKWKWIKTISVFREDSKEEVIFENRNSDYGIVKRIRCSEIFIEIKEEKEENSWLMN